MNVNAVWLRRYWQSYFRWQRGVAVMLLGVSTKLLYVGPG